MPPQVTVDAVEAMRRGSPVHGFNRYAYAQNTPYKYTVPNPEWVVHAFAAAVGVSIKIPDTPLS